jgi:hypothetical protein
MNKIKLNVVKEEKIDNRVNNTGRPVNKKSARQVRLAKQALYAKLNNAFVSGKKFKINNGGDSIYAYNAGDEGSMGSITNAVGMYVCNVSYIGRTKVQGFTYVLNKCVNVEINLKEVTFVK